MLLLEWLRFDTALNLVWVLLGGMALMCTLCASRRGTRQFSLSRLFEVVGVASVVLALFPYISATDDILRIEQLASQQEHQQNNVGHGNNLLRLFETVDQPVISRCCQVALTLFFLELVVIFQRGLVTRVAPLTAGRSPPAALLSA
jgi:hypothetical protein